jgi:hypothetical protein
MSGRAPASGRAFDAYLSSDDPLCERVAYVIPSAF